jgi:hypothetical protein
MRTTDFSRGPAQAQATALFIGANRHAGLRAIARFLPRWWRLRRDMVRFRGYCWHRVYWQFPFTLGAVVVFRDRDALLRFARSRQHRLLMEWLTDGRRNATAGFIRLYTAEAGGYSNGHWRAEAGEMALISHFTPLSTEQTGPPVMRR